MKKILVILLVAVSLFALVSCSDKETAEIFASTDGKIHVNFDKKQDVSTKYVQLGGSNGKKVVSYDVCTSANLTIEPFQVVESINDHINLFTLVAVDDTKKNFVLAITFDGAIFDTVGQLLGDILNVVPSSITISGSLGNKSDWFGGNIGDLPIDFDIALDDITFDTSFGLDGLTLAPIYLTEDMLGALSDLVAGNLWDYKAVAPLTVLSVTYTNGKPACTTTLEKVSARLSFVETTPVGTTPYAMISGAQPGVTYYVISLAGSSEIGWGTYVLNSTDNTFPCKFSSKDNLPEYPILVIAKKSGCVSGFYYYQDKN